MNCIATNSFIARRLPLLAVVTILGLGGSSPKGSGMTAAYALPASIHYAIGTVNKTGLAPLTGVDVELYKSALAAQAVGDFEQADRNISSLSDDLLLGHVLADRYSRAGMKLEEARAWMSAYSDLPEAETIYGKASRIKGFSRKDMVAPKSFPYISANDNVISSGFRQSGASEPNQFKTGVSQRVGVLLRQGYPVRARAVLGEALNNGSISITSASSMIGSISASFFYQGDDAGAQEVANLVSDGQSPHALWIKGLSAWRSKNYRAAAEAFKSLGGTTDLSSWDEAAANYWSYRALSRLGEKAEAYRWLVKAARHNRSFYGHMAASLIGRNYEYSWDMPDLTNEDVALLSASPYGRRALALVQIGRSDLAEGELRNLAYKGSRAMRKAILAFAGQAKLPSIAVQLGGMVKDEKGGVFEAALYPIPPWKPETGFRVDRSLIYALMKKESQFNARAVSSKGACGLMQLMPATARQMAETHHERKEIASSGCSSVLAEPAKNIDIAQRYVLALSEKQTIGDNLLLLLAAYNGGPGNLSRWMGAGMHNDPLLFVESLPARETREYVKQVLLNYWIYRSRLSAPEYGATKLAHGEWLRYQLHDAGEPRLAAAR